MFADSRFVVICVAIGVFQGCTCWTEYKACCVDGNGWQMGCNVGLNADTSEEVTASCDVTY